MAKANHSPLTMWRGKAGGQVYRVSNGRQIVSEYQPKVNNPRTDAQMMQRAKFALAGKLSGITPDAAIFGMDATRGNRRPMFVQNILRQAQAIVDPTTLIGEDVRYIGRIAPQDIMFSKGANLLTEERINAVSMEQAQGSTAATIDISTAFVELENVGAVVIDLYGASSNNYAGVSVKKFESPSTTAPIDFEGVGVHRIYIVPIDYATLGTTAPEYVGLANDDDDVVIGASVTDLVSSGAYGRSYFVGAITVVAE